MSSWTDRPRATRALATLRETLVTILRIQALAKVARARRLLAAEVQAAHPAAPEVPADDVVRARPR